MCALSDNRSCCGHAGESERASRRDLTFAVSAFPPDCPHLFVCQRAREKCGVLYASRREAPDDFDAFRFCVQPHSFSVVIVSQAGKLASKLSPYVGSALIMSCCQVWPSAVAICENLMEKI